MSVSPLVRLERIEGMIFNLVNREAHADRLQRELVASNARVAELSQQLRMAQEVAGGVLQTPSGGVAGEWYRRGYLAGRASERRGADHSADEAWDRCRAKRRA